MSLRIVHFTDADTFKTTEEAVVAAKMDWEIRPSPVLDDETKLPIPNVLNIKRMEKDEASPLHRLSLGVHSAKYEAVPNRKLFAPFDSFLATGQVRIASAGELKQGRVLYMQGQIVGKEEMSVGGDGEDKINPYITCFNGHDGSKSFGISQNSIRIVCQNTLMMSTRTGVIMKLLHKKGVCDKVDGVVEILTELTKEWDNQMDLAGKMRDVKITEPQLELFMRQFMGVDKGKVLKGKEKSRLDGLINAGLQSAGNTPNDLNVWAAYNSVTHQLTHVGGKPDNRVYGNLFGIQAEKNQQAWRQALDFASLAA